MTKSTIFRFNTIAAARSFINRANDILMMVLGENEQIWVVTPADAARLQRAGYELA